MKYLILLLCILSLSSNCYSQISGLSVSTGHSTIIYSHDIRNYIGVRDDSAIVIEGDTVKAIRNLLKVNQETDDFMWKGIDKYGKQIQAYKDFVHAAVDFLNQNPTFITESNCNWPQLLKELKRQGFSLTKLKKPITVCRTK